MSLQKKPDLTVVGHELTLSLFSCSSTVVDVSAINGEEMT
jgi:hypothetical protein